MSARRRRRFLLLSTSVAALFAGGGVPAAYAACVTVANTTVPFVSNSSAIDCIDVENSHVTGDVTNTSTGTITPPGAAPPSHTGITVNGSTIGGAISNAGTITLTGLSPIGIFVHDATVFGGISNSGIISAGANGTAIAVSVGGTVATFGGGIVNTGSISGFSSGGIDVNVSGRLSTFSGGIANTGTGTFTNTSGISLRVSNGTLDTFVGGISNSGTMALGPGNGLLVAVVGGTGHSAALSSFGGGITNSGMITPNLTGISVDALALNSGIAVISNFSGGVSSAGTITGTGLGSFGIVVGGEGVRGGTATLSTFSGGIANSGSLVANLSPNFGIGIELAGFANSGGAFNVGTFLGGISNSGTISYGVGGIFVGGGASKNGSVTIGSFGGGINNSGNITVSGNRALPGIMVGGTAVSRGAVTISNFSGGIGNSGTISAAGVGVLVGGGPGVFAAPFATGGSIMISTFSGGITNSTSGRIVARGNGVQLGGFAAGSGGAVTISTFDGGITNAGTIRARSNGVVVGGTAFSGASLTISSFAGGISNSGRIASLTANGILVGGKATSGANVSILNFSGGVTNSGAIRAGHGIVVGGFATSGSSVSVLNFSGGISNSGRITARTGAGILVGGLAVGTGATVNISSFSDGISNGGTIRARTGGIVVGGTAASGGAIAISSFGGGISNSGNITSRGIGVLVGGITSSTAKVAISAFSGGITNSGSITAGFAGIMVGGVAFSGGSVNIENFTGGISNGGTITAGLVGILVGGLSGSAASVTVSTFAGGITNSGTIAATVAGIAIGGVSTFFGNVSNSGVIAASGVGIAISSFATLVGGSVVNTGLIVANTGISAVNSSPINIFNSGIIVGLGGTAVDLTQASGGNTFTLGPGYSITGNVLGFGNDTFQLGGVGSDKFDLSSVGASQQYQGFTTFNVVSGTWTVFNTFGQSQAWNVDGGILAGTGTLAALNVNNGGTLAPGNIGVPGTFMTVTGDLNFQPGAIYLVQLDPSVASRVNVGGAVTLAGGVEGFLSPGSYNIKTTYDILDPTSITGTFTGFTALNAPGFTGTLTYLPTEVLLNLTAQLGSGGGLNVNQQNVANGINTFFNNGGTLPANFFPVFTLTGTNLANALTQLDGENAADAHFGVFQEMNQFLNLMLDPWVEGRHGGGGGGAFGFAPDREASFPPDVALAYAGVLKAPPKASFDDRWTVWGAAFGGAARIDGDPVIGSTTVTASDYGFAAGMDYRASADTILGFALAGGGTGWNVAEGLGTGRSDAFMAGAYGTKYWGPAYLAGAVAFANHWLSTSRVALGDQLTANFAGQDFAGRVEAGYRYAVPVYGSEIGIAPYAALQTQWFHTPTYSETDATGGNFGLTYSAATVTDTRSELGARFDDLITFNDKPLLLHGRLAWAHDWISGAAQTAAFAALPGASFSVNGAATPTDSALTTAMAEWRFKPRWSLTAKFDGEFASGAQTYAGTGMLRYTW